MKLSKILKGTLIASMASAVAACGDVQPSSKASSAPPEPAKTDQMSGKQAIYKTVNVADSRVAGVIVYPKEIVGTQQDLVCVERNGTSCNWEEANRQLLTPAP